MARRSPTAKTTTPLRFDVVEIQALHGHEQIRPGLLAELRDLIKRDGYIRRPILVADRGFVGLDGHHRVEARRSLGCRRIPAYLVDYSSEFVKLTTWPDAILSSVTNEEVIRRDLPAALFRPQTS